jgi:hypothetical protein
MRGSPLLRAVLALAGLLALAPLIFWMTGANAGAPMAGPHVAKPTEPGRVEIRLTFSSQARRVSIQHLGREVWTKSQAGPDEMAAIELPWPKEGIELRVQVDWPEGAPLAAMRLRLVTPGRREHDRTVWGRGSADEVLTFE